MTQVRPGTLCGSCCAIHIPLLNLDASSLYSTPQLAWQLSSIAIRNTLSMTRPLYCQDITIPIDFKWAVQALQHLKIDKEEITNLRSGGICE